MFETDRRRIIMHDPLQALMHQLKRWVTLRSDAAKNSHMIVDVLPGQGHFGIRRAFGKYRYVVM